MKIFTILFGFSFGSWFLEEGIPKNAEYWEVMQLRADQMFRDSIAEHRRVVKQRIKHNKFFCNSAIGLDQRCDDCELSKK